MIVVKPDVNRYSYCCGLFIVGILKLFIKKLDYEIWRFLCVCVAIPTKLYCTTSTLFGRNCHWNWVREVSFVYCGFSIASSCCYLLNIVLIYALLITKFDVPDKSWYRLIGVANLDNLLGIGIIIVLKQFLLVILFLFSVEAGQSLALLWTCVILVSWPLQRQNVTFWKLSMMSMMLQMPVELHFAVQLPWL